MNNKTDALAVFPSLQHIFFSCVRTGYLFYQFSDGSNGKSDSIESICFNYYHNIIKRNNRNLQGNIFSLESCRQNSDFFHLNSTIIIFASEKPQVYKCINSESVRGEIFARSCVTSVRDQDSPTGWAGRPGGWPPSWSAGACIWARAGWGAC